MEHSHRRLLIRSTLLLCVLPVTAAALQDAPITPENFRVQRPLFSLVGPPSFRVLDGQTTSLFGCDVKIEINEKTLKARLPGQHPTTIWARSGKDMVLKLANDSELAVRIERVAIPGWLRGMPEEGARPTWVAYPTKGSAASFGTSERLLCIDRDGDGVLWELGEDAVLFPQSAMLIPLKETMIIGRRRVRLRVDRPNGQEPTLTIAESVLMHGLDGRDDELAAIEVWNRHRTGVGLEPAWLDPRLSRDCAAHALYLRANGAGDSVHEERPRLPHYSKAGAEAAKASCIYYKEESVGAVRAFLSELYHQRPLLDPRVRRVGFAARDGYTLADATRGREGLFQEWPIPAPGHGQTTDIFHFAWELPDPRPTKPGGGATILLMFDPWDPAVDEVRASLHRKVGRNRWLEVPAWFSDPNNPANAARPQNDGCVAIIPQTPLLPRSSYKPRVTFTDTRTGKRRVIEWVFHTGLDQ